MDKFFVDSDDLFDLDHLDLDSSTLFDQEDDHHLLATSFANDDSSFSLAADLTTGVGFKINGSGGGDNNNNNGTAAAALSSSSLLSETPRRPSSNSKDDEDSGPPQLVFKSNNGTLIYRSAGETVGIKVIHDTSSSNISEEQTMQKLLHEETISKLLPPECNKRQVIEVGSFNERPALYFKWENGITCEEWLDKVVQQQQQKTLPQKEATEFNIRLRAAMAIAKTLHQFHQSYVVYNSLSLENIVLMPFEGEYVAKFIDLSDAVICNNESNRQNFHKMVGDMTSLGLILNQLFQTEGGEAAASTGGDGGVGRVVNSNSVKGEEEASDINVRNVRKRGKQLTPGEGLPLYLGAMISTLLGGDDDKHNDASQLRYESANDVYEDLKVMTTQSISSTTKETELDHEVLIHSRLKLPKDLFYGRQVQMTMIMHLLQSSTMLGDQPLMALIAGYPGTG